MKKTILTLSLIAVSQLSLAANIPGAPVAHSLRCMSKIIPTVGVQVGLKVTTQALAPQYNVRGISLLSKPIVPNAKTIETVLKLDNQNAYYATFKAKNVKVVLDKSTFEATLENGAMEYSCK